MSRPAVSAPPSPPASAAPRTPRITRTQRRHGIEQMGYTGCAIDDSLHDNGSGRRHNCALIETLYSYNANVRTKPAGYTSGRQRDQ